MKWTAEPPKAPGWYWFRAAELVPRQPPIEVVRVVAACHETLITIGPRIGGGDQVRAMKGEWCRAVPPG